MQEPGSTRDSPLHVRDSQHWEQASSNQIFLHREEALPNPSWPLELQAGRRTGLSLRRGIAPRALVVRQRAAGLPRTLRAPQARASQARAVDATSSQALGPPRTVRTSRVPRPPRAPRASWAPRAREPGAPSEVATSPRELRTARPRWMYAAWAPRGRLAALMAAAPWVPRASHVAVQPASSEVPALQRTPPLTPLPLAPAAAQPLRLLRSERSRSPLDSGRHRTRRSRGLPLRDGSPRRWGANARCASVQATTVDFHGDAWRAGAHASAAVCASPGDSASVAYAPIPSFCDPVQVPSPTAYPYPRPFRFDAVAQLSA